MNDLQKGTQIGNYTLEEILGQGGLGEVWLARHTKFSNKPMVAVKFILYMQPDMVRRFEREAEILDKLRANRHIITAEDYGLHNGIPYLIMKYAPGGNLSQRAAQGLTLPMVASYLEQAADGLDFAHRQGIVHRDLKPANIMFDGDGTLLLADFGIAHATDTGGNELTRTGAGMGTPGYMAPEQFIDARGVGPAADIYSLGVIAFKLLTGYLPFDGKTPGELEMGHRLIPVPQLQLYNHNLPVPLQNVIEKALAKKPEERYSTAGEFSTAFKTALFSSMGSPANENQATSVLTIPTTPPPAPPRMEIPTEAISSMNTRPTPAAVNWGGPSMATTPLTPTPPPVAPPRAITSSEPPPPWYTRTSTWIGVGAATAVVIAIVALVVLTSGSKSGSNTTPVVAANPTTVAANNPATTSASANTVASNPNNTTSGSSTTSAAPIAGGKIKTLNLSYATPGIPGHTLAVTAVAVSPDNKTVATGGQDETVRLWDIVTGKELVVLHDHTGAVAALNFSPNGRILASGGDYGDGNIKLYEVAQDGRSVKLLSSFNSQHNTVAELSFSPDSKILRSFGSEGKIKFWDVSGAQAKEIGSFEVPDALGINFSRDGKLVVTGHSDNTIKVWDISSSKGVPVTTLTGHTDRVYGVCLSPDGKTLVSGSDDKTVRIWDIASRKELNNFTHTTIVRSVAYNPNGLTVTGVSYDNTLKIWEVSSGKEVKSVSGVGETMTFNGDGKLLVSSESATSVVVRDSTTLQPVQTFKGSNANVTSLAYSPDGKLIATASTEGTLKLLDASNKGQELANLPNAANLVLFTPDSKNLITTLDANIAVRDIATGKEVVQVKGDDGTGIKSLALSLDGKTLATGLHDGTIRLLDVASGKVLKVFKEHTAEVGTMVFSSDGKFLISSAEYESLKLWDISSGKALDTADSKNGYFRSLAISPDNKSLIGGGSTGEVKLWDISAGKLTEVATFKGHTNTVFSVAFSPDGSYFGSASYDTTIRFWEISAPGQVFSQIQQGREIYNTPSPGVTQIVFSRDGKYLAAGHFDSSVKVWEIGK